MVTAQQWGVLTNAAQQWGVSDHATGIGNPIACLSIRARLAKTAKKKIPKYARKIEKREYCSSADSGPAGK